MAPIDLGSYKSIYLQTAKEYVGKMSLSLDQLSDDVSNKEALNNLHIASHSLKSQSQVMGLADIASLSATIEKISNDILNGVGQVDDKFTTFLRKSVGELNLRLAQIEKGDAA